MPRVGIEADAHESVTKFWDLGNLIAGFAVAQMIATLFTLAGSESIQVGIAKNRAFIQAIVLASNILVYGGGILGCYLAEIRLRKAAGHPDVLLKVSWWAMIGRLFAVVLFTIIGCLGLSLMEPNRFSYPPL